MWQQFGTGKKKKIPLHFIFQNLSASFTRLILKVHEFTRLILKVHVLARDDTMSKAGTKKEALSNGDHVLNLSGFAYNKELMDQKRSQAEEYLVQR